MKSKAVFWDWEGTLYSKSFYARTFLEDSKSKGEVEYKDLDNLAKVEFSKIKQQLAHYQGDLMPFAWYLVRKLREAEIPQVIVSNGNSQIIKTILNSYDLNYFDFILGIDQFDPKPSPKMLQHVIDKKNINASECVFIGDSPTDEAAANKLHVKFFYISDNIKHAYEIAKYFKFI